MVSHLAFLLLLGTLSLGTAQIVFPDDKGKGERPEGKNSIVGPPSVPKNKPVPAGEAQGLKKAATPEARFLPGFFDGFGFDGLGFDGLGNRGGGGFLGLGNLFNPCGRCSFHDVEGAQKCCRKGEIHCCRYVGGFGFGGPGLVGPGLVGPGFGGPGLVGPGLVGPGFGGPGLVGPGFGGPGLVGPGFGGIGIVPGKEDKLPVGPGKPGIVAGGGLKPVGPPGFIPSKVGVPFGFGPKPGYCPKPNFFAEIFGLRSVKDDEGKGKKVVLKSTDPKKRVTRQIDGNKNPPQEIRVSNPEGRSEGRVRNPEGRFLPGFGDFRNPFCRDECFSDFDCPGHLKCCYNSGNCLDCARPKFF